MSDRFDAGKSERIETGANGVASGSSRLRDEFLQSGDSPGSRSVGGGSLLESFPQLTLQDARCCGNDNYSESSISSQFDISAMPKDKIGANAAAAADALMKNEAAFAGPEFQNMLIAADKGGELSDFIAAVNKALKDHGSSFAMSFSRSSEGGMGTSFTGPRYYPDLYHNVKVQLADQGKLIDTTRVHWGGQDPRIQF